MDDPAAARGPVIAVIGAGASGTLAVIHLLRETAARRVPLRVALIDRHGRHGLGQAYSTTHPAHLLNSPADAMSAQAGDPGHLTRWAAGAGLPHDGFLPRSAYGRYLRELLEETERAALPAARVSHLTSDVVAIRRTGWGRALRLYLAADGRIDADAVVLASGNLPPVPPCPLPGNDRYIADPWEPGALRAATDGSPVIVLGTGLSIVGWGSRAPPGGGLRGSPGGWRRGLAGAASRLMGFAGADRMGGVGGLRGQPPTGVV